jgi:hypothetical protein
MKKKCAVFTIVKNEDYFLPIWIKHYQRFFDSDDIYVLDHQSTDGCTDNLEVNVINVTNELGFDHQWLVETAQDFQRKLLNDYECVIFCDSDELIYSSEMDLKELIDKFLLSDKNTLTCVGYEIIQNLETEKSLSKNESILENRNYWFAHWPYNKPLLSKVPTNWAWGFHNFSHYPPGNEDMYGFGLTLCHLHRVDFEFMLKRHNERANKWNLKNDGDASWHYKVGDRDGVLQFFHKAIIEDGFKVVEIPEEHRIALKGL